MPNPPGQAARDLAAVLGVVRAGVGVAVLIAPRWFARALLLDRATADRSTALARMFGARDAVLGIGAVMAVADATAQGGRGRRRVRRSAGDAVVAPWVTAGAVSDAFDVVTLLTDRRSTLRPVVRVLVGASAGAATVLGVAAADRLRAG